MDLTDRQRKLLFAGLAIVLVAVGVYLTVANSRSHKKTPASAQSTVSSAPPSAPASTAAQPSAPAASPGAFDIYPLLPFTRKDFADAADLARRFTAAYGTYRYDEDPKAYATRLQPMVSGDLFAQLQRDASAPGVLDQRKKDQEVSTSDAHLDSIRDIEKDQLILLITGTQHVTKGGAKSDASQQYAVTMTKSGGTWSVYAFQPADVGDK